MMRSSRCRSVLVRLGAAAAIASALGGLHVRAATADPSPVETTDEIGRDAGAMDGGPLGIVREPPPRIGVRYCEDDVFPTCGGECPPYNVCQAVRVGLSNFCACVGGRAECGVNDPMCGGVCPEGLVCVGEVFGFGLCGCVAPRPVITRSRNRTPVPAVQVTPALLPEATSTTVTSTTSTIAGSTTTTTFLFTGDPCGHAVYPVCGGVCAPGEVCVPYGGPGGGGECLCAPAPVTGIPCGTTEAPACEGACPQGTACLSLDQRRVALLAASGCDVERDVPLCPRPLSDDVRQRLREIAREPGGVAADACICFDVVGAPCGFLGAPVCAGECPPDAPTCTTTEEGCACLP